MSTADAGRTLESVAQSIADGAAVDWASSASPLNDREQRVLRQLRLIESLAEVYRTLPSASADAPGFDAIAEADPAGPRWGRLILLDRIGHGASGDVFRAWDVELRREVALKLLHVDGLSDAAANQRVLQEARRLARIRHPHVVHVYGAERHEERIGLWMELVRGRSLDDLVRADGPLPAASAARIGADLCGAAAAVHAAGVLHRDIKAQNVIREDGGRVVLMDLGAGEEMAAATPRLAGTPLYLAPEILAGGHASVQSDIYSIGVLLFHLLTGEYPIHADSVEGLTAAHLEGRGRSVRSVKPDVPPALAQIVDAALAADPAHRYAAAGAMERDLRAWQASPSADDESARVTWRGVVPSLAAAASTVALIATLLSPGHRPTAAPVVTTVAVLPLKAAAGDSTAAALSDGLTDQLIGTLGELRALRVTAHTSVERFRDTNTPAAAIARQLGVDAIVDGTVTIQPGSAGGPRRVRVTARVIKAGTDLELWSGSLERPLGDLMGLEADLARGIARQIHARLSAAEVSRLQSRPATSAPAEQAYLQGRAHLSQFGARATLALDAFNRALAIDPGYAAAHAGAARAYIALGFDRAIPQPRARAAALAEATRALAIDRDLPEGHGVLADLLFYYDWNFPGAEREYRLALDAEPSASYERAQYAQFLAALGRPDEARAQVAESVALDPLSAQAALTQALVLYYGRRFDEAIGAARHAEALDPTLPTTHFLIGRILEAAGDLPGAARETQRAIEDSAVVATGWRVQALRLQALRGNVAAARQAYASLAAAGQAGDPASSSHEAYLLVATGEPDAALAVLARAVERRDPSVLWIDVDPRLDPVRKRPEFAAVRRQIGLP